MVLLSKIKLNSGELMRTKNNKFREFEGFVVDVRGMSRGLALLWRNELNAVLCSVSSHHIDVVVREGIDRFYGWPKTSNRHLSWMLLEDLATHS